MCGVEHLHLLGGIVVETQPILVGFYWNFTSIRGGELNFFTFLLLNVTYDLIVE